MCFEYIFTYRCGHESHIEIDNCTRFNNDLACACVTRDIKFSVNCPACTESQDFDDELRRRQQTINHGLQGQRRKLERDVNGWQKEMARQDRMQQRTLEALTGETNHNNNNNSGKRSRHAGTASNGGAAAYASGRGGGGQARRKYHETDGGASAGCCIVM